MPSAFASVWLNCAAVSDDFSVLMPFAKPVPHHHVDAHKVDQEIKASKEESRHDRRSNVRQKPQSNQFHSKNAVAVVDDLFAFPSTWERLLASLATHIDLTVKAVSQQCFVFDQYVGIYQIAPLPTSSQPSSSLSISSALQDPTSFSTPSSNDTLMALLSSSSSAFGPVFCVDASSPSSIPSSSSSSFSSSSSSSSQSARLNSPQLLVDFQSWLHWSSQALTHLFSIPVCESTSFRLIVCYYLVIYLLNAV
jgi:hypothetical protein